MKARPPFVFAFAFSVSALILSLGLGCDAESEPVERVAAYAAPSECDGACSEWHCGMVLDWRAEAEAAGNDCAVACRNAEIECLHDPPEHCGWCGLDSHDCVEACDEPGPYCDAELAGAVLDDLAERERAVCESGCYTAQLECMIAADATVCGQCELDAAVCRSACL